MSKKIITDLALAFYCGCSAIFLTFGVLFIIFGKFTYPLESFNDYPIVIFVYGFVFFNDLLKIANWSMNNLNIRKKKSGKK